VDLFSHRVCRRICLGLDQALASALLNRAIKPDR
jgi:hypothetical protein